MSIYSLSGVVLDNAHNAVGDSLPKAYDISGNMVFSLEPMQLKVMTYNVGSWYDGSHNVVPADKDSVYYALQSGMIQQNNPDIMLMNEYTKNFSKTGRTAKSLLEQYFPYVREQGGDSDTVVSGRCIASKYPISDYTVRNYTDGGYYYDSCTITVNSTPINLIVTHLHWNDRNKRSSEIDTILALANGFDKCIIAGDMNTLDCRDTDGEDYFLIEKFLTAGYRCANCTSFGFMDTYEDNGWVGCLDNIVVSSNIEILSAYVDETKLSDSITDKTDHMPFIATINIY